MNTTFETELNHVWGELFLAECARLAESHPYMDGDEIEARAEETVNEYLYLKEREILSYYWNSTNWRRGWE